MWPVQALHGQPLRSSYPIRGQQPGYGGSSVENSFVFVASPYGIYYFANGVNMSLCLEQFKDRIRTILAYFPENPTILARAGIVVGESGQGYVDMHHDLGALQKYADSGLNLIFQIGS